MGKLVTDYALHDHEWLQSMYALKEKRILTYSKMCFAVRMTTTSRSEGMNAFFDQYVNTTTGIKDFVSQSQKALDKQYQKEKKEDYETIYKELRFLLQSTLEIHGAKMYTREMFRRFQMELQKSIQYIIKKLSNLCTSEVKMYALTNASSGDRIQKSYTVVHYLDSDIVKFNCQMFEHASMPCRHMLRFFTQKNYNQIPAHFILPQWTRDANKIHGHVPHVAYTRADYKQSETLQYNHLCSILQGLAADAACTIQGYQYMVDLVEREKPTLLKFQLRQNAHMVNELEGQNSENGDEEVEVDANALLLDPLVSQTKGRK